MNLKESTGISEFMSKLSVGVFILTLAPALVAAQSPMLLGADDIYFTWKLAKQPLMGPHGDSTIHATTGLCGFQILGNHRNTANPRVEWDMNIDSIRSDSGWISALTADTFEVVGQERKPRPPIIDLSFSIKGDSQPILAKIEGAPNADNGIKAFLETEPANRLFAALSDYSNLVTIALKYKDNTSEVLQIRGYRYGTTGGKNSAFNSCLRGYTPIRRTRPVP
jgi:hypothetical protein